MTVYIGGPETPEKLAARQQRYLDRSQPGGTFAIVLQGEGDEGVGWVGYWPSEWQGEALWEVGWSVLPEYQGRGIAAAATRLCTRSGPRRWHVSVRGCLSQRRQRRVQRRVPQARLRVPGRGRRGVPAWAHDAVESLEVRPARAAVTIHLGGPDAVSRWGFTDEQWFELVARLQALLVEAARGRGTVTYGEIARRVFDGRVLARSAAVMSLVDDACDRLDHGRGTVMASLVVRADTGMPGEGYFAWALDAGYDVSDRERFWREQAERVWESWSEGAADPPRQASTGEEDLQQ